MQTVDPNISINAGKFQLNGINQFNIAVLLGEVVIDWDSIKKNSLPILLRLKSYFLKFITKEKNH